MQKKGTSQTDFATFTQGTTEVISYRSYSFWLLLLQYRILGAGQLDVRIAWRNRTEKQPLCSASTASGYLPESVKLDPKALQIEVPLRWVQGTTTSILLGMSVAFL